MDWLYAEELSVRSNYFWSPKGDNILFLQMNDRVDPKERLRMQESGVDESVSLALPGKDGPLGIISVGSTQSVRFQRDEISYLANIVNLLALPAPQ